MGQCLKNGPLKTRWHINGKETFIWISRGVRKESILKTLTLTYSVTIKCFGTHKSNNIMQTKRRKVITITIKNVQIRSIQSYWCHKTNKTASEKYKRHPNVLEIKEKTKIKN